MMADMGFEQTPEEALNEIRKYPKIARAEVFGKDSEHLVIQTNDMYIYTPDRYARAKLGVFTIFLNPDRVQMKNSTPIDNVNSYRSKKKGSKNYGQSFSNTWSGSDAMHHPHVTGSYVSLAAHESPLLEAVNTQDWMQAANICIQFLEAYKFGDKAKQFFEREMEMKNENSKQWEVVEFDPDLFQKEDLKGTPTYNSYGVLNEQIKEIGQKMPVGSRIRLVFTSVHSAPVKSGDEGVITHYSKTSIGVDWDVPSHSKWTVMPQAGDDIELVSLPKGIDPDNIPEMKDEDFTYSYGTYDSSSDWKQRNEAMKKRNEARKETLKGVRIKVTKVANFHKHALPVGSTGIVTSTVSDQFSVDWDDESVYSIIDPLQDAYEIIEYPGSLVAPGSRIRITKPAHYSNLMKVGLTGVVTHVSDYVMQVDWDEDGPHNSLSVNRSDTEWEVLESKEISKENPIVIDLTGEDEIKKEDKESRPPIKEFSASSGAMAGGSPEDDDAEAWMGGWWY